MRLRAWSQWVARTSRPILVGPWHSEVGFECLYWLPWLMRWRERYRIPPERLIALTRGGAGVWYQAGRTVELYDYAPPEDWRVLAVARQQQTGLLKQLAPTDWDRAIVRTVAVRLGLRRFHVLHPSVMYHDLSGWWADEMPAAELRRRVRYWREGVGEDGRTRRVWDALPVPALPLDVALPPRYVAVRWYDRPTWPLNDAVLDWVRHLVVSLSQEVPVVVLGSGGAHLDDHVDAVLPTSDHIVALPAGPVRDNLAVQSAVIARAQGFVGTYGGLMQLAVRLGVPAAGFYLSWEQTSYAHKALTEWLGVQRGVPGYIGTPAAAETVRQWIAQPMAIPQAVPRSRSS